MPASKQPQRKAQIAWLVEERGWNRPCPANIFFHVVLNTMAMEREDEQRAVAVPVAVLDGRQGMSPPRRRGFGTCPIEEAAEPLSALGEKARIDRSHHEFPFPTDKTAPREPD